MTKQETDKEREEELTGLEVFGLADLAAAEEDIPRRPLKVWGGKVVWVYGINEREFIQQRRDAMKDLPDGGLDFDELAWTIARFIACIKDSPDPKKAKPIFNMADHFQWLQERNKAIIDGAVNLSIQLSEGTPGTIEVDRDFFERLREERRPASETSEKSGPGKKS